MFKYRLGRRLESMQELTRKTSQRTSSEAYHSVPHRQRYPRARTILAEHVSVTIKCENLLDSQGVA